MIPLHGAETGEGRVVAATVYRDRALVTRSLEVELRQGSNPVEMIGLPADLDQDSLRVQASGPRGTVLEGFETREVTAEQAESPEYLEAESDLRDLQFRLKGFQDRLGVLEAQAKFLESFEVSIPNEIGKKLAGGDLNPENWQIAFDFLGRNLDQVSKSKRETQREIPALVQRIKAAQDRLEQIGSKGKVESLTAVVTLRAPSPGSGEVRVEYLTQPASWYPVYQARYDRHRGELELIEKAMVRQETGEDWVNIQLTLSTARPGHALDIPEPVSLPLRRGFLRRSQFEAEPPAEVEDVIVSPREDSDGNENLFSDEYIEGLPVIGRDYSEVLSLAPGVQGGFINIGSAVSSRTEPVPSGQAVVVHEISTIQDIPSDGQFHRYGIGIQSLVPEEEEFRAAPRYLEGVFLRSKVKNTGDHSLLEGKIISFDGPNLLGSSVLEERAPGEEFTIPFGPDPRFRATRQRLSRVVDAGRRQTAIRYVFLTTVESFREEPRRVVVEDLLPVSQDDQIDVRLEAGTTPGYEEDPEVPGLLRWSLDLGPRDKTEIRLVYEVRYPTGWMIDNLE